MVKRISGTSVLVEIVLELVDQILLGVYRFMGRLSVLVLSRSPHVRQTLRELVLSSLWDLIVDVLNACLTGFLRFRI